MCTRTRPVWIRSLGREPVGGRVQEARATDDDTRCMPQRCSKPHKPDTVRGGGAGKHDTNVAFRTSTARATTTSLGAALRVLWQARAYWVCGWVEKVVDGQTFQVIKTYPFMQGIRPTVITADEKTMYSQQSYLNALIKFDLTSGMIMKTLDEPLSDFAKANYPTMDDYPHDSAHHGLAMSGDGSKLCDSGTIDNTVSIVSTADLTVSKIIDVGLIPYWATTSADGEYCFVSLSGDGAVSVIDYDKAEQVMHVKVGKFPQRSRRGQLRPSDVALLLPAGG